MRFLVTNIKYSIEQEDIDAYREDENIDDEVTDEEIVEEIEKSLPQRLIVEADNNSDEYEEEICNAISDATGWCIESFEEESLLDFITSKLNNFMEEDHEFWEAEFGCEFNEIVDDYGFGWYCDDETDEEFFSYVSGDSIINIDTPVEDILNKIFEAGDDVEKLRNVIFWIYENND